MGASHADPGALDRALGLQNLQHTDVPRAVALARKGEIALGHIQRLLLSGDLLCVVFECGEHVGHLAERCKNGLLVARKRRLSCGFGSTPLGAKPAGVEQRRGQISSERIGKGGLIEEVADP